MIGTFRRPGSPTDLVITLSSASALSCVLRHATVTSGGRLSHGVTAATGSGRRLACFTPCRLRRRTPGMQTLHPRYRFARFTGGIFRWDCTGSRGRRHQGSACRRAVLVSQPCRVGKLSCNGGMNRGKGHFWPGLMTCYTCSRQTNICYCGNRFGWTVWN